MCASACGGSKSVRAYTRFASSPVVAMEVSLWLSWSPFGHGFQIHGLGSAAPTLASFLSDGKSNVKVNFDLTLLVHHRINLHPHTGPYWSYQHARFITQYGSYCTFSKSGATAGFRDPAFVLRGD